LAAAALALTAGLGLLAFAKYFGFIFLGPPRSKLAALREPSRWPAGAVALGVVVLFLGAVAPWEIRALGSALSGLLGFNLASTTISHPLVLGPVFENFSVLAPTWLAIVLPAYALIAALIAFGSDRRERVRRAPVWITGSGASLDAVQYRPSAYSNPMRVILRGPLGYRSRLTSVGEAGAGHFTLTTSVVFAVDRFLYQPATALALLIARRVRALQSGRLSQYLLYVLIALILALALVPILR
jgi:hydrogenase-4 component B